MMYLIFTTIFIGVLLFSLLIYQTNKYFKLKRQYARLNFDYSKIVSIMRNGDLTEKGKLTEISWEIENIPF